MILEHTSIICIIYLEKPGRLCYYIPCRRDVAQLGRALRSGRKGRRFESCHPDHIGTQVLIRYLRSFSFFVKSGLAQEFSALLQLR